jgi:acetoin utilization deacetylase AcuC-like enzyme
LKYWSTRPGVGLMMPIENGGFCMLSNAAVKARMCVISRVIRNCSACLDP